MCDYRRCADDHNIHAMAMVPAAHTLNMRGSVHRGCPETRWVDRGYASSPLRSVRDVLRDQQLRFQGKMSVGE